MHPTPSLTLVYGSPFAPQVIRHLRDRAVDIVQPSCSSELPRMEDIATIVAQVEPDRVGDAIEAPAVRRRVRSVLTDLERLDARPCTIVLLVHSGNAVDPDPLERMVDAERARFTRRIRRDNGFAHSVVALQIPEDIADDELAERISRCFA